MPNNIAEISISLSTDSAALTRGFAQANQDVQRASASMSGAVGASAHEARGALMVLGEEFGIRLPREMRTALAGMEGFGSLAAELLGPALALQFASVIAEKVIPAIESGAQAWAGWSKAEQDAYKLLVADNKQQIEDAKKLRDLQREISLIGLDAVTAAQKKAEWAKQDATSAQKVQSLAAANAANLQASLDNAKTTVQLLQGQSPETALAVLAGRFLSIGPFKELEEMPKKVAEAQIEARKATVEMQTSMLDTTKATKELGVAQDEANKKAIEDLQKQNALRDEANRQLVQMQLKTAQLTGDIDGQAAARKKLAQLEVKSAVEKAGGVLPGAGDALAAMFRAIDEEAAATWAKIQSEATKAVADLSKAGEAGVIASLNLGPTPGLPTFRLDPLQEQLDQLARATPEAAKERGQIMDQAFETTRTHAQQLAFQIQKLNIAFGDDRNSDTYKKALQELKDQFDINTIALNSFAQQAGSAFQEAILHTHDFKAALVDVIEQLGLMILKMEFAKSIEGMTQQGGTTGFFGGLLGGLLGIGHASGGPVTAGMGYVIGENGPESFVPATDGYVMPNSALQSMGSGVSVTYAIDARGADAGVEARVMRAIRASHDSAVQTSMARIYDRQKRR